MKREPKPNFISKEKAREVFDQEKPIEQPTRRKVVLSLNPIQFAELEALMLEDVQTNFTTFGVYLIMQEKKRREEEKRKRGVGRPKGSVDEDGNEEEEPRIYPHPDNFGPNKGRMLTKTEFDWYVEHSGGHV